MCSGAVNVPVVLVPSLAVFSRPVQAVPVPVEAQPVTAKEVSQKDTSPACLGSLPAGDACKPAVVRELSQETKTMPPSSSAPPVSAPVPQQLPTRSTDKPASCDKKRAPHASPAEDSASGNEEPAHGQAPTSSIDEAASARKDDPPEQLPANLPGEPASGNRGHVPPQKPASLGRSASCHEGYMPEELPASSPNEVASNSADHMVDAGEAVPMEAPVPPCPSTREARRASAPAILALKPQQYLPAYEAVVAQGGAPVAPVATQANAHSAPQDCLMPPIDQVSEQLQPHDAPAMDRADSAPVPEFTSAEGASGGDAMAPRPVSLPDLAAPHEDSALDEPGTPTGQDGNAPGATFASAVLSPHPEFTQHSRAPTQGGAENIGIHLKGHPEMQVACASPEAESINAESFLCTAPDIGAPDPVQHASTVADHGCSGSGKNDGPLASKGYPSNRVSGARLQAVDVHSTPPTSRQLEQAQGGIPLLKQPVPPLIIPLSNAELPHQRQHGSFPAGPESWSYDMHGPPAMVPEANGMPLHAGSSQQQRFKQQQLAGQSGAEEHDAFGPLLAPILGMDIGADPIIMEEDLARFDRDLASAWHQDASDMR